MDRPRLLTPARPTGMTRRSLLGLGAAAATSLLLPGCSRGRSDEPAPAEAATFASGNPGGVYNVFGSALSALVSEVTGMELKPLDTNGSVDNLRKVASGAADLAFSTSDSAFSAYEGTGVFQSGSLKFSALARVYDNYIHVVVPMTSEASTLTDLASLRDRKAIVSVGPKNSGTELIASLILRTAGLDVDKRNMTLEESVDALGKADPNGKAPIDAFIWSGGVPTDPIAALQDKVGFRLLDIGAVAEMIALKEFGGYVVSSIPPSQYKLASSVPTLAVPNYLVAKPTLSDSWAWWTVNTLFRRQNDLINSNHPEAGELDPRSAIATMPVPLHPAAERWYRQNHI